MDMDARGLIADFTDAASVAGLHAAHIDHERLTAPHQPRACAPGVAPCTCSHSPRPRRAAGGY